MEQFYDSQKEWFVMESAPQDGTEILVYDESEDRISLVSWGSVRVYYPNAPDETGWMYPYSDQDEQGGAMFVENPTCWKPVPNKPNSKTHIIFESIEPISLQYEDANCSCLVDNGNPEEVGGDQDRGIWVRIGSWDEKGWELPEESHTQIKQLEGKRVRVTLEIL